MKAALVVFAAGTVLFIGVPIVIAKCIRGRYQSVADDLNTAWPASAYTPDPDNWADPT